MTERLNLEALAHALAGKAKDADLRRRLCTAILTVIASDVKVSFRLIDHDRLQQALTSLFATAIRMAETGEWPEPNNPTAYWQTALRNKIRTAQREESQHQKSAPQVKDPSDIDFLTGNESESSPIDKNLLELDDITRHTTADEYQILKRVYVDKEPVTEVAESLGIGEQTLRKRLSRLRSRIRSAIRKSREPKSPKT